MTSWRCWARSATYRSSSAVGPIGTVSSARRIARSLRPSGEPPGSRVARIGSPAARRRSASRPICVVFPEPSIPSNVTKNPRRLAAEIRRGSAWGDGEYADSTGPAPDENGEESSRSSMMNRRASLRRRSTRVKPRTARLRAAMKRALPVLAVLLVLLGTAVAALYRYKQNPIAFEDVHGDVAALEPEMVDIPGGTFT